jgi:hypothetical protein
VKQYVGAYKTVANNTIPNVKCELVLIPEMNCTMCLLLKFSVSFLLKACSISKEYMAAEERTFTLPREPLAEML